MTDPIAIGTQMFEQARNRFAAEELRKMADEFDRGLLGWVADRLNARADELDPCACPGEHCGECGCCP